MDIPLLRSPWVKLVIAAVALYAIWVLMLLALQRSMIFPGAGSSPGAPNESALSAAGIERWWLDTDEGKVEAWYAQSDQVSATEPGPAVIFAHGNAEVIDGYIHLVTAWRAMGVSVLLVEFRGYGRSDGVPSQQAITEDAVRFYDRLVARPEVDPQRVFFQGRSLGGGVVCDLAIQRPPAALILMSTFTSVARMARSYLVPGFLVSHPFDNLGMLADYEGPILLIHGKKDRMIPVSHAREMAKVAPDATLIEYPCDHNDCPPDWKVFWDDVSRFLEEAGLLKANIP
jgi:pimeloyl-ACP methyl ester carboxylesterase